MREKIAEWLHSWAVKDRKARMPWLEEMPWYTLEPDTQERWREKADEILALLKQAIEGLPSPGGFETDIAIWEDYCQKILNLLNP